MRQLFGEFLVTIFMLLINTEIVYSRLPSSIVPCPRNSTTSDFEQCLLDLLTTLKPYLAAGDLGDGFLIRRIEPLYIDMLPIDSVELKINMTNVYSTGGSSLKFTSVKADLDNLQFDIGSLVPKLDFKAQYSLHQHFKSLRVFVKAIGDISGVFLKIRQKLRVKFEVDNEFVKLKSVQWKMKVEDARFNIETLSVQNEDSSNSADKKVLRQIANNFINADPSFVLRKVEPHLEKSYQQGVTEIIEPIFKNVSLKELFL